MITKNLQVDALQIKRQGAVALAALLADMTPEQQRRFWEERTRALLQLQQAKRTERRTAETVHQ
jgi:hypothetical protein